MTRYAQNTSVSAFKSREEIERVLQRYGADQFMYGTETGRALVAFRMNGRQVKFILPMPDKEDREFTHTPAKGSRRSNDAQLEAWEKACRQRWRALALVIKAKLEAVESGITEFDSEFLAHIVLPDGQTFGTWARPQLESAYSSGNMPPLLPDYSGGDR